MPIAKSDESTETLTLKNPDFEGEMPTSGEGIESSDAGNLDPRTQFNEIAKNNLDVPVFLLTPVEQKGNSNHGVLGFTNGLSK